MNEQTQSIECSTCKHCHKIGETFECRRYPPTVTIGLLPPSVMGAEPKLTKHSAFPNCNHRCGEFALAKRTLN